jgi:electron transfer flavoprotein alpha subunit
MPEAVYILVDHDGTSVNPSSLECLVFGQEISSVTGKPLHALLLGSGVSDLAERLAGYNIDSIILVEDALLEDYTYERYCAALSQILGEDVPSLLVMAHTYQNIEMAPRLSARLEKPLISDCIGFKQVDGELLFTRRMFRAKLYADVRVQSPAPWIVTLQAGSFLADALVEGRAQIIHRQVDLAPVEVERKSLEIVDLEKDRVDLSQADRIVAVGRGLGKKENMELVRELADVLKAEIGASRPAVDSEWLSRDRQIGSSGQTVSPRLYIAVGISGAIQHVVGMKSAQCIVAINSDRNAPVFNIATYGVLGDLQELVPALTERLRKL